MEGICVSKWAWTDRKLFPWDPSHLHPLPVPPLSLCIQWPQDLALFTTLTYDIAVLHV